MEFKCLDCNKVYRPHRFIAFKHPSRAECPRCNSRKKERTELGTKIFKSIHAEFNKDVKERRNNEKRINHYQDKG